MFKKGGLFGLWKPKNQHSLDHLKYLYSVLYRNQTVTESNRSLLVETLRSIAEILIWGDQNDSTVFDFFLERNMLSFFLKIMNQKCGSYVCVQLLQTLNILFENIRNETSIYYLLSNNHVNSIIVHKFDFSDEEVMAYYISFLKTLSFRLNKHTIHFFYNEHTNDFPLYTEAIKFFNHSESMVRIAVRTLTLNVYRVEEESMLKFVIDKTAVPYFSNLVWFIGNHILEIDACVRNDADHRSLYRLKDLVAEHLDHLHYLNDILCLEIENLNQVLTDHLLNRLLIPLYIYSLVRKANTNSLEDMKPHVSKVTALFLLSQIFLILTHEPLVRLLAWIIVAGDTEIFTERGAAKIAVLNVTKAQDFSKTIDIPAISTRRIKPSFVAPSLPLEKSIKEQIKREEQREREESRRKKKKDKSKSIKRQSVEREEIKTDEPTEGRRDRRKSKSKSPSVNPEVEEEDAQLKSSLNLPAGFPDPKDLSITDEEKELMRIAAMATSKTDEPFTGEIGPFDELTMESRPFLTSVFESMDPTENDYLALFALCLIYAIQQNSGIGESLLVSVRIPSPNSSSKEWYNHLIMEKLLRILNHACQYGSRIRLVTLDLTIILIKELVLLDQKSFLLDDHFAQIEGIKEESTLMLRNFYKSEEIFLDMFEDEYRESSKPYLTRMEFVLCDASLLLPPTGTPLTGIEFPKRLPCGEVERARHSIRTFFRLRQLSLEVEGKPENKLPLSNPDSCIQIQDVLDLNNSDLLAVTVNTGGSSQKDVPASKQRRFLVVDVYQIVLVEPDSTRLGWGVATFVGFLQDLEVVTDKDDSRCLHVTVHSPGGPGFGEADLGPSFGGARPRSTAPLLSATFTFDDHIRCMAAKQRLTKGRVKARQRKMHQIARLLEMPGNIEPSCPSPPTVNLHLLRKEAAAQRRTRTGSSGGSNQPFGGITISSTTGAVSKPAGAYRPMFAIPGKVPGSAALMRASETAKARTQSRSSTPESAHSDENPEEARASLDGAESRSSFRSRQRRLAASKLSSQERPIASAADNDGKKSEAAGSPSSHSFMRRTSSRILQSNEIQEIPLENYGVAKDTDDE